MNPKDPALSRTQNVISWTAGLRWWTAGCCGIAKQVYVTIVWANSVPNLYEKPAGGRDLNKQCRITCVYHHINFYFVECGPAWLVQMIVVVCWRSASITDGWWTLTSSSARSSFLLPAIGEISRDVGNSENLSDIPHKDKDRHVFKIVH